VSFHTASFHAVLATQGVTTTVAQVSTEASPVPLVVAQIATPEEAALPVTSPDESTPAAVAFELLHVNV
jgi:hypothetical protein